MVERRVLRAEEEPAPGRAVVANLLLAGGWQG